VTRTLALSAARRLAVAAQGFAGAASGAPARLASVLRRLSCVQLDSISAVERSHRIVLACRAGPYPRDAEWKLVREGKAFETWAHEACLVPIEDYPLFRYRMRERRIHHWFGPVIDSDPALARSVLDSIRERGALRSRDFEGRGGGGMWNWKPAKRMLDALWTAGELAIAGRVQFQRLYDLPSRVIPRRFLEAPVPDEAQFVRAAAFRAVKSRGVLTAAGIVDHYRLGGGVAGLKPHLEALLDRGDLRKLELADGGAAVFVPGRGPLDATPADVAVLLSPFDNLLWDRAFAARLFRFAHLIEVYKPRPERRYGYYVLPLLVRDRIVGRADLKSDRLRGVLRIHAFHREPGARRDGDRLDEAVARLAADIGLAEQIHRRGR
jgi:uncharacterized protein YcaQ